MMQEKQISETNSHQNKMNKHEDEEFQSFSQGQQSTEKEQQTLFRKKNIQFVSPPKNIPELFKTYQSNQQKIKSIRAKISQLNELSKINTLVKYDEENLDFQQCYDIDQVSEFYERSQQLYQEKEAELRKLKTKYKQLNSDQLEAVMLKDPRILKLTQSYIKQNRKVISIKCYSQFIVLLTEESWIKRGKKKKLQETMIEGTLQMGSKKSGTSSKKSKCQDQRSQEHNNHLNRHFMIRFINYQQLVPQVGLNQDQNPQKNELHPIILPNCFQNQKEPINISYDSQCQMFIITFNDNSLQYLKYNKKQNKKLQLDKFIHKRFKFSSGTTYSDTIRVDNKQSAKIIFVEAKWGFLYVGSSDGILRMFQAKKQQEGQLKYVLVNTLGCFLLSKSIEKITHYSFPETNPNEILFVGDKVTLGRLSILTYRSDLIHTFQDPIKQIFPTFIETSRGQVFLKYYQPNSGKLNLKSLSQDYLYDEIQESKQHTDANNQLKKGLTGIFQINKIQFSVSYEGLGILKGSILVQKIKQKQQNQSKQDK